MVQRFNVLTPHSPRTTATKFDLQPTCPKSKSNIEIPELCEVIRTHSNLSGPSTRQPFSLITNHQSPVTNHLPITIPFLSTSAPIRAQLHPSPPNNSFPHSAFYILPFRSSRQLPFQFFQLPIAPELTLHPHQ